MVAAAMSPNGHAQWRRREQRERPVHCSVGLGIRGWRGDNPPSEELLEVVKTVATDPVVVIEWAVTLVERLRGVLDHELCPTESAVIVIPARVPRISSVGSVAEFGAPQISFLPR